MNITDIDLGEGHSYEPTEYKGEFCGILWKHPACPDYEHIPFTGGAWANEFKNGITTWECESKNPLTLSPSLLCRACNTHGFIRNGKWVQA